MDLLRTFTSIANVASKVTGAVNPGAGLLLSFVGNVFEQINRKSDTDTDRARMMMEVASWMMRVAAEITQACADGKFTAAEFEKIKAQVMSIRSVWKLEE